MPWGAAVRALRSVLRADAEGNNMVATEETAADESTSTFVDSALSGPVAGALLATLARSRSVSMPALSLAISRFETRGAFAVYDPLFSQASSEGDRCSCLAGR